MNTCSEKNVPVVLEYLNTKCREMQCGFNVLYTLYTNFFFLFKLYADHNDNTVVSHMRIYNKK